MDNVPSLAYHAAKVTARASPKNAVETRYGMPNSTWRTSR
jgi:hypothetical protein